VKPARWTVAVALAAIGTIFVPLVWTRIAQVNGAQPNAAEQRTDLGTIRELLDHAREVAVSMDDKKTGVEILWEIASTRARVADRLGASEAFDEVVPLLISQWVGRPKRPVISCAFIRCDGSPAAKALMTVREARESVLRTVVVTRASGGDIDGALSMAAMMDDQSETLIGIAEVQVGMGDLLGAEKTLARLRTVNKNFTDENMRAMLGIAQAETGQTAKALQTAEALSSDRRKLEILQRITLYEAKRGNPRVVNDALRRIEESGDQGHYVLFFAEVATAQAHAGNIQDAQKTANLIDQDFIKQEVLKVIDERRQGPTLNQPSQGSFESYRRGVEMMEAQVDRTALEEWIAKDIEKAAADEAEIGDSQLFLQWTEIRRSPNLTALAYLGSAQGLLNKMGLRKPTAVRLRLAPDLIVDDLIVD
jgi:hypothetical protein